MDEAAGSPYGILAVPGSDLGLQLLLSRTDDGAGVVLVLPYRVTGTDADGNPIPQNYAPVTLLRGDTKVSDELGISISLTDFGEYTLLIAKSDPGQGLIWLAFLSLIAGITITFYLPRRRVWARARAGWPSRSRLAVRSVRGRGARVRSIAGRPGGRTAVPARLLARPGVTFPDHNPGAWNGY